MIRNCLGVVMFWVCVVFGYLLFVWGVVWVVELVFCCYCYYD